jgi:acyl carrier protein
VERLVLEYAQNTPPKLPLNPALSLQGDLAIESLSLVSLTVRLGDELGVDVSALDLEIDKLRTVGDLVSVAKQLSQTAEKAG